MTHVHIVGAGIAGLACAVRVVKAGGTATLYEAAGQAGGRCRTYYDSQLKAEIDNGNHILLTANHAALDYVREIGARDTLIGPARATFPFVDLASGQRWTIQPSRGPIPWWILSRAKRIPGTRISSYLAGLALRNAGSGETVADRIDPDDALWSRFWEPLTVAALNTSPHEASARLLWLVLRETFAKGEAACRPLIARDGLAHSLVEPALTLIRRAGCEVRFNCRLRGLELTAQAATSLNFGDLKVALGAEDAVVLALPPAVAQSLVPDLRAPTESRPIVNAHIRLPPGPRPSGDTPFIGLVGGDADWIFVRGGIASLTVSAAEGLAELPSPEVARRMWSDTARAFGLEPGLRPLIRVLKEKRATFAQTPEALARRAPARTVWQNLFLAGDWTDTGYPATIESAVRSGRTAADLAVGGD